MSGGSQPVLTDSGGKVAPQYYEARTDIYEYLEGHDGSLRVGSLFPWRDDFAGSTYDATRWSAPVIGAHQTLTFSGSILTLGAGTTLGEITKLTSLYTYKPPFRVWWIVQLSQRIANNTFTLGVIDAGGQNGAGWQFDGTTATTAKQYVTNNGTTDTSAALTIPTTAAYSILEMEILGSENWVYSRPLDSQTAHTPVNVKQKHVPEPTADYYLQITATNGGTNPASNTNLLLDSVSTEDWMSVPV